MNDEKSVFIVHAVKITVVIMSRMKQND